MTTSFKRLGSHCHLAGGVFASTLGTPKVEVPLLREEALPYNRSSSAHCKRLWDFPRLSVHFKFTSFICSFTFQLTIIGPNTNIFSFLLLLVKYFR